MDRDAPRPELHAVPDLLRRTAALKERLWRANYTRCVGGEYDNTEIVKRIAELRLRIANLLGHESYADYVLEDRMAERAATVNDFLADLLDRTRDYAVRDYETVNDYADSLGLEGRIMPWDWAYYSEKYKEPALCGERRAGQALLPKLENVVKGVFLLANKCFLRHRVHAGEGDRRVPSRRHGLTR